MSREGLLDRPGDLGPGSLLSVVLPAYNEGDHLHANLHRIARCLSDAGCQRYELIVVDDGSRDQTGEEAERAEADGLPVQVVRHAVNAGKGAALLSGTRRAGGDLVAFLDADLEIGPDQLLRLMAELRASGSDVVVGVRSGTAEGEQRAFPLPRRLMSRAYRWLVRALFDLPMETQTGLKLFRHPVLAACLPRLRAERFAFDVEILTVCQRLGYRIAACPVTVEYRRDGRLGRMTVRQIGGMLAETLAIYYRASFWCWLQPGLATRAWIVVLSLGVFVFGIGVGKLLTPVVLSAQVRPIFYVVALQFLPRTLRDGLLVVGGAAVSLVAIAVLNKRILAAFARRDGGDLAGIWRWAPPSTATAAPPLQLEPSDAVAAADSEVADGRALDR